MARKFNFTKSSINDLLAEAVGSGKRLRARDDKTRGLLVDVTANGAVSFWVRRTMNTRSIWERLGEFGEKPYQLTVEGARREAYRVLGLMESGFNPQQVRQARRAEPTLQDVFDHYIEDYAKDNRKTWKVMQRNFDLYIGSRSSLKLARRKASDVTFADVKRLKESMRTTPYAANRTLQLLRAIYNRAIRSRMFTGENPVVGIVLNKETPRSRFLSAEEVQRFIGALNTEPIEDTKDFITLCLLTGARKTNVLSMRFEDIDLQAGTWTIQETKNGTSQTIALTGTEIKIIKARQDKQTAQNKKSPFIFPGSGTCGHLQDPDKTWTLLRRRARLPDITIHDLRRNLGSWMASENVNVALIKGALNHKDMKTTLAVYARTSKQAERDARLKAHEAMSRAAGKAGERIFGEASSSKRRVRRTGASQGA